MLLPSVKGDRSNYCLLVPDRLGLLSRWKMECQLEKKPALAGLKKLPNLYQSLLNLPRISQANRQVIAPRTMFSRSFIEVARLNLTGQVSHLGNVFYELCRRPTGRVPFDLGLFGLYQNAEGDLLRFRYGELV